MKSHVQTVILNPLFFMLHLMWPFYLKFLPILLLKFILITTFNIYFTKKIYYEVEKFTMKISHKILMDKRVQIQLFFKG